MRGAACSANIAFIIGVSLEGSEALQDHHRPDKRGQASYPAALRGIALLHRHQVEFNLLVVVHNEMARHAAAIYDRLSASAPAICSFSR
jgi:uncharacterized protein